MTDLVVISLEAWDEVWRRNQHLVAGLLRADPELRVLFVEPPADPLHDVAIRRVPRFGARPRQVASEPTDRLWTMRPVKLLPRRIDRGADRRLATSVVRTAARLGMPRPLLWINDPRAAVLASRTAWPTLYDMTDDWLVADRPPEERQRLAQGERTLLEAADEVVACSPELVRRKSPDRRGRPIELIRNAVDTEAYRRPHARPHDLPSGACAVYVGTVHADRFDVDLCVATAERLGRAVTTVLVGPLLLDASTTARLSAAGVVLLGQRPHDEVVAYLQHAAVLIVPHRIDAFTDSLDPIKLYEYQAAGRPVVTTAVAGFRDADDPRIVVAEASDFADAVLRGVAAGPSESVESTPLADWSDRVAEMRAVIARLDRVASSS